MANMASVSYAIEGPKKTLEKIFGAIFDAVHAADNRWEEYIAAEYLKLPIKDDTRLGGEIFVEPLFDERTGALRFWAEEKWGLQDFEELLIQKFSDIKVYWVVEEPGMEIYCTNDKEGKYFPERYWVDTCIDDIYNSEYFITEEQVYAWLDKLTYGRVKTPEDVEKFNEDYEGTEVEEENWIVVHEFEVED